MIKVQKRETAKIKLPYLSSVEDVPCGSLTEKQYIMTGKLITIECVNVVNNYEFGTLQVNCKVDTSAMSIKQLLAAKGSRKVTLFLRNNGVKAANPAQPTTDEVTTADSLCKATKQRFDDYDDDGKGKGKMDVYEYTPLVSEIYGKKYAVSYVEINGVKTPIVFEKLSHVSFAKELTPEDFKGEFSASSYELTDTNPLESK